NQPLLVLGQSAQGGNEVGVLGADCVERLHHVLHIGLVPLLELQDPVPDRPASIQARIVGWVWAAAEHEQSNDKDPQCSSHVSTCCVGGHRSVLHSTHLTRPCWRVASEHFPEHSLPHRPGRPYNSEQGYATKQGKRTMPLISPTLEVITDLPVLPSRPPESNK